MKANELANLLLLKKERHIPDPIRYGPLFPVT